MSKVQKGGASVPPFLLRTSRGRGPHPAGNHKIDATVSALRAFTITAGAGRIITKRFFEHPGVEKQRYDRLKKMELSRVKKAS